MPPPRQWCIIDRYPLAAKRAGIRPRAFSLIELLVAVSITGLITVGLASALRIAIAGVPDAAGPGATATASREAMIQITRDLHFALAFTERTPNAVTFTVPDRDGDGFPETIRYAWSGAAGGPLTWRHNDGNEAILAESVDQFELDFATRTMPAAPLAEGGAPILDTVLMVVGDPNGLTSQELARQTLLGSWGYDVVTIAASDSPSAFADEAAAAEVAYVPCVIDAGALGTKLTDATIGVVNEHPELADDLQFSASHQLLAPADAIDVIDHMHYITLPFALGALTVHTSPQPAWAGESTPAPGLRQLGQVAESRALVILEVGAVVGKDDLGNPIAWAAGRRVQIPWGGAGFDFNALDPNGRLLLRRAIDWGNSGTGGETLFGYEDEFTSPVSNVAEVQIATKATLGENGTVIGLSAYVNCADKKVRLAVYADAGGEPGALLVESEPDGQDATPLWITIPVAATALPAGDYWLALAFDRSGQTYFQDGSGETRYRNHDAEKNGFLSDWGFSDDSFSISVSIYATYVPE